MTRRQSQPVRPRRAARQPSATANVELPEGDALVGPFGDYARWLDRDLNREWARLSDMAAHPAGGAGRLPDHP